MLRSKQREGSPWRGLSVVFFRELFDHLTSVRMLVLEFLVVLLGGAVVYFAAEQIRNTTAEDPFLFLRLFAPPGQSLLSFVLVLSILVPILAIGLGFDAINGEYNRRTMSRILAQPIYRDALLFGKFLAGLATISISLVTLWLLVIGFGLLRLGVPPSGEEIGRLFIFLLVTIAYAGIWVALACSSARPRPRRWWRSGSGYSWRCYGRRWRRCWARSSRRRTCVSPSLDCRLPTR